MKREQIDKAHADDLYAAILQLQTVEEVESFFFDLCTPAELEGIVDRWRVAQMLVRKIPYRQIAAETNVSTATIVRVARFLNNGNDGYRTIMRRLGKIEE
ncbi:MAG: YerC/YecD family TrpR-related protein [Pseudomonadota bacterium]|nr:YerC/YecD family TrpR-related protein [Pseudomonadota bacterium]MEC8130687.1 YerC/YecD family TrpR-related protein [Pseudomonadota bacterium]MEC8145782.1 YerC/YecD family TrpR-related protein [Pseudomonadota bacterium]MEC8261666.1 YerC/YecD family TrpR-related protein [Pseudomonadota bacterium]